VKGATGTDSARDLGAVVVARVWQKGATGTDPARNLGAVAVARV
jgi:hypothetical protein